MERSEIYGKNCTLESPAWTTLFVAGYSSAVSAGLGRGGVCPNRRLKPTVNKVLSLRDFLRMRQFEMKVRRSQIHLFLMSYRIFLYFCAQTIKRFPVSGKRKKTAQGQGKTHKMV
jgi:hypothetical protein